MNREVAIDPFQRVIGFVALRATTFTISGHPVDASIRISIDVAVRAAGEPVGATSVVESGGCSYLPSYRAIVDRVMLQARLQGMRVRAHSSPLHAIFLPRRRPGYGAMQLRVTSPRKASPTMIRTLRSGSPERSQDLVAHYGQCMGPRAGAKLIERAELCAPLSMLMPKMGDTVSVSSLQ